MQSVRCPLSFFGSFAAFLAELQVVVYRVSKCFLQFLKARTLEGHYVSKIDHLAVEVCLLALITASNVLIVVCAFRSRVEKAVNYMLRHTTECIGTSLLESNLHPHRVWIIPNRTDCRRTY